MTASISFQLRIFYTWGNCYGKPLPAWKQILSVILIHLPPNLQLLRPWMTNLHTTHYLEPHGRFWKNLNSWDYVAHMWLCKFKLIKTKNFNLSFLRHTSHISSDPWPHVAGGGCIEQSIIENIFTNIECSLWQCCIWLLFRLLVDGSGDEHTQWINPSRERQISYNVIYMRNLFLKIDTNEFIHKTEIDPQT